MLNEDLITEIEITEENKEEIEKLYGAIPEEIPTKPITHKKEESIDGGNE